MDRRRAAPARHVDRELVAALRAEVAAIDPSRPCDRAAEADGLGAGSPRRSAALARLTFRLALGAPHVVGGAAVADAEAPVRAPRPFDWDLAADHCRTAWLRGLFLARGSLSLAGGRTHLEFVVDAELAPRLAARLGEFGMPAGWRLRRGQGVVSWKNAEIVGTFLRMVGAGGALLEVEARQVARAVRGDLNRVINAESANLQRAVAAASRQLEAIAQLEAEGRLADQPYVVRVVAEARRETPESTFGELAERLELTRSAVQRALERVERLALQPVDEPARTRRRA